MYGRVNIYILHCNLIRVMPAGATRRGVEGAAPYKLNNFSVIKRREQATRPTNKAILIHCREAACCFRSSLLPPRSSAPPSSEGGKLAT